MTGRQDRDEWHQYLQANRRHWDEVVPVHAASDFYDVASFKAGKTKLKFLGFYPEDGNYRSVHIGG